MAKIKIGKSPAGSGYRLEAAQFLPSPCGRVFEFFSDAFQLQTLTPSWLEFSVLTPPPICMKAATLIDYRLRLHGVPLKWQSRISDWDPPARFVDEQTRGPYRRWHHEHLFESVEGGTLVRDIVDYCVPGGLLMHWLVRSDLLKIFRFRQATLLQIFSATPPNGRFVPLMLC